MRGVIVMFDSLNRHLLSAYGCGFSHTPNFQRLARRTCTFDTSYVCSMPCMPARRDLHTGRPNFLHRGWGPLEPYDVSVFEALRREAGVHSHLVTDHYHYFEDGAGGTYHNRYSTYEQVRGQEGDHWAGRVGDVGDLLPKNGGIGRNGGAFEGAAAARQDYVNRSRWRDDDAKRPMTETFRLGREFVRENASNDNWLLHVETFDPHEPFDAPAWAKDLAAEHFENYDGSAYDWPVYDYASKRSTQEQLEHLRQNYLALLAACDAELGRVLDLFDELSLWDDTALYVCTDHGFFLGERDCLGKMWMPWWDTLARTPFFAHDPREPAAAGQRRKSLVQPMLDLGPTLCELFGVDPSIALPVATGTSMRPTLSRDESIREAGLFGMFGQQVNVTDGRHVYMRAGDGTVPPAYTLMPADMKEPFPVSSFTKDNGVSMAGPFDFTQEAQVMRIPRPANWLGNDGAQHPDRARTLLYDVEVDPGQERPLDDPQVASQMEAHLIRLMDEADAPAEQASRLGLAK